MTNGYCHGLNKASPCHKGCPLKKLEQRVEGLYKSIHGIAPDQADNLQNQIDKLAKYILEYFPDQIIDEGACLTAIGIMEKMRTS